MAPTTGDTPWGDRTLFSFIQFNVSLVQVEAATAGQQAGCSVTLGTCRLQKKRMRAGPYTARSGPPFRRSRHSRQRPGRDTGALFASGLSDHFDGRGPPPGASSCPFVNVNGVTFISADSTTDSPASAKYLS